MCSRLIKNEMDDLEKAREDLWNHSFLYHKLGTITISRMEG